MDLAELNKEQNARNAKIKLLALLAAPKNGRNRQQYRERDECRENGCEPTAASTS